jgi:hypothetical protein
MGSSLFVTSLTGDARWKEDFGRGGILAAIALVKSSLTMRVLSGILGFHRQSSVPIAG